LAQIILATQPTIDPMIAVCRILLVSLVFLIAIIPAGAASRHGRPFVAMPSLEALKQQAMIFFVAKGAPNSCGPGCSEWIAAEGAFDPDAPQRLREFLALQPKKGLPIFFHSNGGLIGPSVLIGYILREQRITAGVGQTIPEGCRAAPMADSACRKLMRSRREAKARLHFNGARCASGCAYALFGASARRIGQDARIGVHASRVLAESSQGQGGGSPGQHPRVAAARQNVVHTMLRRYAIEMGVDAGIIDLAQRTSPDRMHWLSRDEMVRFGILTNDIFETQWEIVETGRQTVRLAIAKSITWRVGTTESFVTTHLELACFNSGSASISMRREIPGEDISGLRIVTGDDVLLHDVSRADAFGRVSNQAKFIGSDSVHRLAAADSIIMHETTKDSSREIKISTKGLAGILRTIPGSCGVRS
jgi:hypothetical protein